MGPWEVTGNRYEASGSFPMWPVREYSALNCSTERISSTDSLVGLGGGAGGSEEEAATVELGGAKVARGARSSGCGRRTGEVGRGELGRGEVGLGEVALGEVGGGEIDRVVVTIGEVVVITGEVVGAAGEVVTGAEIGSEVRGGDGGIGSSDCTLSP